MASISVNTKKFSDLTAVPTTADANQLIVHDGSDMKRITMANFKKKIVENGASAHNCIWRGKNLGTSISATQWAEISAGTFDDMFVGDYWTINGTQYMIADFDYFYNCGDGGSVGYVSKHHLVMIPKASMYTTSMNIDSNTTEGGYVGSDMYKTGLDEAITKIEAAFGDHLQNHYVFLCNAVTDERPSGRVCVAREVDLMTESMVYGHYVYAPANNGTVTPNNVEVENRQLACWRIGWRDTFQRAGIWLQNPVSATNFATLNTTGLSYQLSASTVSGVRPYFLIS